MRQDWIDYYFSIADVVATKSKDPSTKVGAVIIGPDKEIRSTGYNCLPRGVVHRPDRDMRPIKYLYYEHAERNAIYNAAAVGIPTRGCIMVIAGMAFLCADCARAIIQSGIIEVWILEGEIPERWVESIRASVAMLKEAGIKVRTKDANHSD